MNVPAEPNPSSTPAPTDEPSLINGGGAEPDPKDVADATEDDPEGSSSPEGEEQFTFDFAAVELPEGLTVSEEQQTAFTEIAVKYKIPVEAAKDLFTLYGAQGTAQAEALTAATTEKLQASWKETNAEWVAKTKTEFGAEQPAVLTRIGDLLNEFGDQEVRQAFDVTGAGNHPAVVRMLNRLAVAVGEGTPVNPAGQPNSEENPLFKIYPSMAPKQG